MPIGSVTHARSLTRLNCAGFGITPSENIGRSFSRSRLLQSERVSVSLQIEKNSGPARTGRLLTPHAEIETPVFMPVGTVASVKGVPQDILEDLGAQIILGNTYHLYLRPGIETVRRMGGLE